MGKKSTIEYWTTRHEKEFISQLGVTLCADIPRHKMLQKYRESMERRVEWDQLDKEEIAAFVDRAIEEEAAQS